MKNLLKLALVTLSVTIISVMPKVIHADSLSPIVQASIKSTTNSEDFYTKVVKSSTEEVLSPNIFTYANPVNNHEKKYVSELVVDYLAKENSLISGNIVKYTISPMADVSGSKSNGIVRASIRLEYSKMDSNIKITKCSGSWTKLTSTPTAITNRYVTYRGPNAQLVSYRYPSSDSYSYYTGWGYASQNTAGNGRAYSSANTSYVNMGQLFLEASVTIP